MKRWLNFLILISCITSFYGKAELSRPFTKEEKEVAIELYDIGIMCFDPEVLENFFPGFLYYIDLRSIISYPDIYKKVINLFSKKAQELSFDCICGVPYTGLPFASTVAFETHTSLIMRRAHRKSYATAKKIEGLINPGMGCLLIDDIVFTGISLLETIDDLENEHIKVTDCIVLMEREQGGIDFLKKKGYQVHTIFKISDFLQILQEAGKIDDSLVSNIMEWTKNNQVPGVNWKKNKN